MDLELKPQVERWSFIELAYPDEAVGSGENGIAGWRTVFTQGSRTIETEPFPGNNGGWRVRFMPDEEGEWLYETISVSPAHSEELAPSGIAGRLQCTLPAAGNHGPVCVVNERQFGYADGTPYVPFGTTCRNGWRREHAERMLSALETSPFNKVRFYVGMHEIDMEALDTCILRLRELGIEAELVLDCQDNDSMTRNALRQVIARLAAYRNVSWSLKIPEERGDLQEELLQLIHACDPYGRLLTLFSTNPLKAYGDRRITHVSLQAMDASQVSYFALLHCKPVLLDECGCEGNGPTLWGSLPGEELMHRVWESVCRGGYAGHSEMLLHPNAGGNSWYTNGEKLDGEALPRIAFLRSLLSDATNGLQYMPEFYDAATIGLDGRFYLQYFGIHRYPSKSLHLPEGRYVVEVIDTWNMTIEQLAGEYGGTIEIPLPARLWHALRIRRIDDGTALHIADKDVDAIRKQLEENDNFI